MILVVTFAAIGVYFVNVHGNPPGYYIDESSISYNAYTIAQTGRDEFGAPWPLYFRAFGDYKNPIYIYLLSGIYRLTGPSIRAARSLSAIAGVLAALLLGLLGWQMTRRREVASLVTLTALLTPWLFEISRVVLEVALYPLILAVFLFCARRSSTRERWSWLDALTLAGSLALITYTYSIGRLLGPLLAFGLVFFATRSRRWTIVLSWGLYLAISVPMLFFNRTHPGAIAGRFYLVSYLDAQSTYPQLAWKFVSHYFGNLNPWRLFVTGDPNPEQIAHIEGTALLTAATGFLIVIGIWLILDRHRDDPWFRFFVYGLVVSVIPASLTKDYVHMLRLAPFMVFLLVLTIPAIEWLWTGPPKRQRILVLLVGLMVIQGALFQWQFHAAAHSPKRLRQFDNGYPQILARAVSLPNRPIYLADAPTIPSYIQAYWYATLIGVPLLNFVRLAPDASAPEGALVITTEEDRPRCQIVSTSEFYTLYIAKCPLVQRDPLPPDGFRATITMTSSPSVLHANQKVSLPVLVRNDSTVVWLARERSGGRYQVSLGNRWLDTSGNAIINDDGRAVLRNDLRPGEQVELKLAVNAPHRRGDYLLEIDMLQEGVSWFGLKGSATVRRPIHIE
jgi:4-amino-4-deoxy-L-arabinose transferase-like glycosyltransferase